jgi:hypothetical protein
MGFDLGGALTKLTDPGALAHAAADAILPPDMQWLGGLVGAAVDMQAGNPFGAITQGLDSIKDLNELSAQQKKPGSMDPTGGWRHEPPPPPPRTTTTTTVIAAASVTTTSDAGGVTTASTASAGASVSQSGAGAWESERTAPKDPPPPTAWRATPANEPSATSGALRATPPTSQPSVPPPPSGSTIQGALSSAMHSVLDMFTGRGAKVVGKMDPSTMSKDQFMGMDNESFMKAIRDGKIPKEISDSPAAMQALQARMNQISEMNQLMTSMIQAMHQMQMAVIQNVRV